jgi:bifunctional non-homologous end joining protein LigD
VRGTSQHVSGGGDRKRLEEYRRRRDPSGTPEPFGGEPGANRLFVIQEHHARRLHWDFRLERDGVLVSWAVPKGLPPSPETNHLAVQTEDHPLDYADFEGEIPPGEYGAGRVLIFDRGSYDTEKWSDREVKVVLHGRRVNGRYVLFRTRDTNWLVHRMDQPAEPGWRPVPDRVRPMRPTEGDLPGGREDRRWGYEFAWNGRRALVRIEGGQARVLSARGDDVTERYPELRPLGPSLGATAVLLDGEIVAFGEDGRPSASLLRQRTSRSDGAPGARLVRDAPVTYLAFDLLHVDGRPALQAPYRERRRLLDELGVSGAAWQVAPWWSGGGRDVLRASQEQGLAGVVAKRLSSTYQPGVRSPDWILVAARSRS